VRHKEVLFVRSGQVLFETESKILRGEAQSPLCEEVKSFFERQMSSPFG
jgi:hypothetical protein